MAPGTSASESWDWRCGPYTHTYREIFPRAISRSSVLGLPTAQPAVVGRRFIQAFAADSTETGWAGEASPLFRAGAVFVVRRRRSAVRSAQAQLFPKGCNMDDEEETYRLWKIRKTIMQASRAWGGLSEC